jgi:tetrahydromethanopterin S-methyltransferase subunit B
MISEIYLKRAYTIRKEYLKVRNDIESYENVAKDLINSLEDRKSDFEKIVSDLNSNKFINPESAKIKLTEVIMVMEEDMNRIEKSVNNLNGRIDKLKIDEQNLYSELKRSYTDLNDDEIKKSINEYLSKKNLS